MERARLAQKLEEKRGILDALTLKSREEVDSLTAQVGSLKADLKEKDEEIDRLETDLARMREWGDKYKMRSHENSTAEKYLISE